MPTNNPEPCPYAVYDCRNACGIPGYAACRGVCHCRCMEERRAQQEEAE